MSRAIRVVKFLYLNGSRHSQVSDLCCQSWNFRKRFSPRFSLIQLENFKPRSISLDLNHSLMAAGNFAILRILAFVFSLWHCSYQCPGRRSARNQSSSLWLSSNPSKRWGEVFFLSYTPFWLTLCLGIVVPFKLYEVCTRELCF